VRADCSASKAGMELEVPGGILRRGKCELYYVFSLSAFRFIISCCFVIPHQSFAVFQVNSNLLSYPVCPIPSLLWVLRTQARRCSYGAYSGLPPAEISVSAGWVWTSCELPALALSPAGWVRMRLRLRRIPHQFNTVTPLCGFGVAIPRWPGWTKVHVDATASSSA
jgi:hypothetical protein